MRLLLSFSLLMIATQLIAIEPKKQGNPIITDKYTADPAALVYNDTVYLYAGHDE